MFRKLAVSTVTLFAICIGSALAQENEQLYTGMNAKLTRKYNPVKQTSTCILTAYTNIGNFEIIGTDAILFYRDSLVFDYHGENIARGSVGGVINLGTGTTPTILSFPSSPETSSFIKDVVNGREVSLQYTMFPSGEAFAWSIKTNGINVGYRHGVEKCGWVDINESNVLPAVNLKVDQLSEEGVNVHIDGQRRFEEIKSISLTKYTGILDQCVLRLEDFHSNVYFIGVRAGKFGIFGGYPSNRTISVTDPTGVVLFQDSVEGKGEWAAKWKRLPEFIQAVRQAGPEGYLLDNNGFYLTPRRYQLYGLLEIYEWGTKNCEFPAL